VSVNAGDLESRNLGAFKRSAHQYLSHLPKDDDLVSWLAIMQHYGAPTRLLDWTKSPYVAAYFAAEEAQEPFAIWAIDLAWLSSAARTIDQSLDANTWLKDKPGGRDEMNNLIRASFDQPVAAVVQVEPSRADSRMDSQRGFFLCKLHPGQTFDVLLIEMLKHLDPPIDRPPIRKLEVSIDLRFEFLHKLRQANVHRGSLFPGLDGLARSLHFDWLIEADEISAFHRRADK